MAKPARAESAVVAAPPAAPAVVRLEQKLSDRDELRRCILVALLAVPVSLLEPAFAVHSYLAGKPFEVLAWFAPIPLLMVLAVCSRVREAWMMAYRVPPLEVFASAAEVRPGDTVALRLVQPGPLDLAQLMARLACYHKWERRTWDADRHREVRTIRDRIFQRRLVKKSNLTIEATEPWVLEAEVKIPADARPTSETTREGILWRVEVRYELRSRRMGRRAFVLRVAA